tara:strand:- start:2190 stop:3143 length:954 start_codon:yes stop_codon:yes gene_type:complete
MAVYLGRNSQIVVGEESTWGTAASLTNARPVSSGTLARQVSIVPRPDLLSDSGSAMRRGHYQSEESMTGSFEIAATYENVGMFLKHAMGTLATTGSGDPYTHTYTLAADLPTGLTMEFIRGTSGKSEKFEGCKLNNMTMSVSAGECMMMSFDVMGQTGQARATASSPSLGSAENLVHHHHAGQFTFNSVAYDLRSMTITVNNSLTNRQLLGSVLTHEPVRSDFMSVECSFELEAADTLYAAMVANTQSDATITFTHPTVSNRSMAITLQNMYLTAADDGISDAGIVSISCTGVCESDGTDEGFKVVIQNGDSTGIGN